MKFNINNYEIFDLLKNSNLIEDIYFNTNLNSIKKEIMDLCSEEYFYGPIANNVKECYNKIDKEAQKIINRLKNISSLSVNFKFNYKTADKNASNRS